MLRPIFLVLASLLVFPAGAAAQPAPAGEAGSSDAEAMLQQAEEAYGQLEYEAALQILVQVLQLQEAVPMQKARALLYMGVCFTALGRAEDAVQAFTDLLKLKPDFRLPDGVSPSIKAMFKEALERLKLPPTPPAPGPGGAEGPAMPPGAKMDVPVSVETSSPRKVKEGQPIDVTVELADPQGLVHELLLRWRVRGSADYSSVKVKVKKGQRKLKARIPGAALAGHGGKKVLYFVEAQAQGEMTLAHAGSMSEPLTVALGKAPAGRSRWAWWLLGIGGALVVAGGVVAAVLLTQAEEGTGRMPDTANVTVIIK